MAEESGGNPLVATVDTGSWTGTANVQSVKYQEGAKEGDFDTGALSKDTEGAGLFSDAASTIGDAKSGNWGGLAVDAVGDGMDALGVAMDPLGSLAGAGIGWLIEHVGFLKKPLDYLAGQPELVTAKSQTWTNVSKALSDAADQYEQSAQRLQGSNTSDAVNGASATGGNLATVLRGASTHASDAATAMQVAATLVGTTRGVIRDTVSQFAGDAVVKWAAATAAAFFTFGATEAAFVVDEVAEGTSIAARDAGKVSEVVSALSRFKSGAKDSETALKDTATDLDRGAKNADSVAHDASDAGHGTTDHGKTAPNDTGGSTTPSADTPAKQHYWQKEEEGPSHEELTDDIATHKESVDAHNDNVAQHNRQADDLKQQVGEHNKQAVDNQQALAANKHARDMNQQAVNRSRAQGKSHDSLNAQHRQLQSEHKNFTQEDQRLGQRQQELSQRQSDLHDQGTALNKEATDLHSAQDKLTTQKGADIRHQTGLENSRFEHNPVISKLNTVHKIWEGPEHGPSGDMLKEPVAQALSDQHTRNDAVAYESQTTQHEWQESHEQSAAAEPPSWPTEHQD